MKTKYKGDKLYVWAGGNKWLDISTIAKAIDKLEKRVKKLENK